jgi:hypothetical protein
MMLKEEFRKGQRRRMQTCWTRTPNLASWQTEQCLVLSLDRVAMIADLVEYTQVFLNMSDDVQIHWFSGHFQVARFHLFLVR